MDQTILNWLLGGVSSLIGFLLHSVWQAVKDLQTTDRQLSEKVSSIEVLVAGQYVKHSDLKDMTAAIFKKLDKIEDKLDGKVDKP